MRAMDDSINRQDLLALESRIEARLNAFEERLNARFATKDDLAAFEERLSARFATKDDLAALEERLSARFATKDDLAALEERMRQFTKEVVHEVETKLLSAFFSYAERTEKVLERLATEIRSLQASDQNLEERLRLLENRVFNLEKKLLQQPPAA